MGNNYSLIDKNKCNYNCPVCKLSGKIPNKAGRFFIINNTQCQCNACNTIYPKHLFYKNINLEVARSIKKLS